LSSEGCTCRSPRRKHECLACGLISHAFRAPTRWDPAIYDPAPERQIARLASDRAVAMPGGTDHVRRSLSRARRAQRAGGRLEGVKKLLTACFSGVVASRTGVNERGPVQQMRGISRRCQGSALWSIA
jgi:hypothetical protein